VQGTCLRKAKEISGLKIEQIRGKDARPIHHDVPLERQSRHMKINIPQRQRLLVILAGAGLALLIS